jgi:aerobic C4-dicarboxylate transport protein
MNIDPASSTTGYRRLHEAGQMVSTTEFLLNVIPSTVTDAAKGEILQVC